MIGLFLRRGACFRCGNEGDGPQVQVALTQPQLRFRCLAREEAVEFQRSIGQCQLRQLCLQGDFVAQLDFPCPVGLPQQEADRAPCLSGQPENQILSPGFQLDRIPQGTDFRLRQIQRLSILIDPRPAFPELAVQRRVDHAGRRVHRELRGGIHRSQREALLHRLPIALQANQELALCSRLAFPRREPFSIGNPGLAPAIFQPEVLSSRKLQAFNFRSIGCYRKRSPAVQIKQVEFSFLLHRDFGQRVCDLYLNQIIIGPAVADRRQLQGISAAAQYFPGLQGYRFRLPGCEELLRWRLPVGLGCLIIVIYCHTLDGISIAFHKGCGYAVSAVAVQGQLAAFQPGGPVLDDQAQSGLHLQWILTPAYNLAGPLSLGLDGDGAVGTDCGQGGIRGCQGHILCVFPDTGGT